MKGSLAEKTKILPLVLVFLLVAGLTTVYADSPHFVHAVTATLNGSTINVCFKESGLGSGQTVAYQASANGTATYVCVNSGGNCPSAANKTTVNGPLGAIGSFTASKSGTIQQCLSFSAVPSAGSFSCPGGQSLTVASFSVTGIAIADTTNNIGQAAVPSSVSATLFTCP